MNREEIEQEAKEYIAFGRLREDYIQCGKSNDKLMEFIHKLIDEYKNILENETDEKERKQLQDVIQVKEYLYKYLENGEEFL